MKTKILGVLSFSMLTLFMNAQSSTLEIFSENGQAFFLTVNGVQQNEQAAANVRATDLRGEFHRVSITFEDNTLGSASQNIALEPGMEQRASIVMRKNGSYAIRPFGEPTAIGQSKNSMIDPAPSAAEVHTPAPARHRNEDVIHVETAMPAGSVTTTTTTTTTTTGGSSRESVRMDVGVGEQRMGISIEINDPLLERATMTTTTTVNSTETVHRDVPPPARSPEAAPAANTCAAMEAGAFSNAKRSINSKSFADDKKTTARQILRSNCMSTAQIKEVMALFSFEDDKLEFAKTAYDRCSDPQNYWKINDAFTFSDSIEQLDEFLQNK